MTVTIDSASIDQTLLALADPTRRAILGRLSRGEARVTELAEPFDMSLNAVSKHIRLLEKSKLVRRRIEGREHFLSYNSKPLDETLKWLKQRQSFWTARLDMLEKLLRDDGISVGVINARFVKPLDRDVILQAIRKCRFVVTVEESALMAGFGSAVLEAAADAGINTSHVRRLGISDEFIEHGERGELLTDLGLDAAGIALACRTMAIRPAPTALPPGDRRHVARLGNLPQR